MYNVLDSNILYNHSAQPDIREGLDITRIWKKNFHDPEGRLNTDTFYRSTCTKLGKWEVLCVLGVSILPLSTIFLFDFGTVPTVWYFWVFHFIPYSEK